MRDGSGAPHERTLLLGVMFVRANEITTGELLPGFLRSWFSFAARDEPLDFSELGAAQCAVLVRFGASALDVGVFSACDDDGGIQGEAACFDLGEEFVLDVYRTTDLTPLIRIARTVLLPEAA